MPAFPNPTDGTHPTTGAPLYADGTHVTHNGRTGTTHGITRGPGRHHPMQWVVWADGSTYPVAAGCLTRTAGPDPATPEETADTARRVDAWAAHYTALPDDVPDPIDVNIFFLLHSHPDRPEPRHHPAIRQRILDILAERASAA